MVRIQRLPVNRRGNDYVMGDLHGEIHLLEVELQKQAFDPGKDRLFSVGDLIDRGGQSRRSLDLLKLPYFFAVLGNHEQMMVDAVLNGANQERWLQEGGSWSKDVDEEELRALARQLSNIPHIIVVGDGSQRFQVVHAGLVDTENRPLTDAVIDDPQREWEMKQPALLHARTHARRYKAALDNGIDPSEKWHAGLSITFCGHTPVPKPGLMWSHYFCDGGAGSEIYLESDESPTLHVVSVDAARDQISH